MAGTPKRAAQAEAALEGTALRARNVRGRGDERSTTTSRPLTDWRASADYRRMVAANLFRRFWLEQTAGVESVRICRAVGA